MAKSKPLEAPVKETGMGRKQTRGPLGPSTPEVTVFASFEGGEIIATPSDMTHKGRKIGTLVTDDQTCIERISHNECIVIKDKPPRLALLEVFMQQRQREIDERIILVAGSADMVQAAIDDAWRVIGQCKADSPVPYTLSDWRLSRPKDASATTLTRD